VSEFLRILMVEDNPSDALLVERELREQVPPPVFHRVETETEFLQGLAEWSPDLVLSDYNLPAFDGMRALRLAQEHAEHLPVIIVTGAINEETAVECMKAGAVDYVLKDNLGRLPLAVTSALERARLAASHRRALDELRRVRRAVEESPVSIMMTDRHGVIEYVNPKFTEVTGYSAAEAIGATPRLLKSGRNSPALYEDLWATVSGGAEWRGELINRRKNGEFFWERVSVSPVRTPHDGTITHFVAVKEDITERKMRERELSARSTLTAALNREAPRRSILGDVLDQMCALLDADGACFVAAADGSAAEPWIEAGRGVWGGWTGRACRGGQGAAQRVMRLGERYVGDELPVTPAGDEASEPVSVVGCPVIMQEATLGSLWLGRRLDFARGPFHEDDLFVLPGLVEIAAAAIQRATMYDQTRQRLQRLMAVKAIDEAIASSLDLRLTLNVVLDHVGPQLGVDACAILLLNPHFRTLDYAAGRGFVVPGHQEFKVRLGEAQAGAAALERRVGGTPDACVAQGGRRSQHFAREGFRAHYVTPLATKGQVIGVLEVFHRAPLRPDAEWMDFFAALAEQAAIAIENARLFSDLQRSNDELAVAYDATIEGWVSALDLRDKETEGHTQRVTEVTLELARLMGFSDGDLVHVRRGALMHDIGKMGVPDAILQKPGPLTEEERAIMERHAQYAHEWLHPIRFLRPALDIPYCHHERMDGSGYPRGLKGTDIPLSARIFAVVDVWDALRSERVYRSAWPEERVIEYLKSLSGTLLDAQVVSAFMELRAGS